MAHPHTGIEDCKESAIKMTQIRKNRPKFNSILFSTFSIFQIIQHAVCQSIHRSSFQNLEDNQNCPWARGGLLPALLLHVLYYSIITRYKLPLSPSHYQNKFIHKFFFFLMKATVQIHKAQRTHICSTHNILYKLDMDNSTELPYSPYIHTQ